MAICVAIIVAVMPTSPSVCLSAGIIVGPNLYLFLLPDKMDADVLCAAEYTVNSMVGCLLAAPLIFWGSCSISKKCCIFTTHIGENIKANILDFTEGSASKWPN